MLICLSGKLQNTDQVTFVFKTQHANWQNGVPYSTLRDTLRSSLTKQATAVT